MKLIFMFYNINSQKVNRNISSFIFFCKVFFHSGCCHEPLKFFNITVHLKFYMALTKDRQKIFLCPTLVLPEGDPKLCLCVELP